MSKRQEANQTMHTATALLIALLTVAACAGTQPQPVGQGSDVFRHEMQGEALPWTDEAFDNDPDTFTFAIFSDLTGGEREGIFSVAVEQLRLLRPQLIVNVGDLVEGGDVSRTHLEQEWDYFDARAGRARAPVFYTGGNHDLSSALQREIWQQRYGRSYYHFVYKKTLFLVLDTEDNPPEVQAHLNKIRNEADQVLKESGWDAWRKPSTASPRNAARAA